MSDAIERAANAYADFSRGVLSTNQQVTAFEDSLSSIRREFHSGARAGESGLLFADYQRLLARKDAYHVGRMVETLAEPSGELNAQLKMLAGLTGLSIAELEPVAFMARKEWDRYMAEFRIALVERYPNLFRRGSLLGAFVEDAAATTRGIADFRATAPSVLRSVQSSSSSFKSYLKARDWSEMFAAGVVTSSAAFQWVIADGCSDFSAFDQSWMNSTPLVYDALVESFGQQTVSGEEGGIQQVIERGIAGDHPDPDYVAMVQQMLVDRSFIDRRTFLVTMVERMQGIEWPDPDNTERLVEHLCRGNTIDTFEAVDLTTIPDPPEIHRATKGVLVESNVEYTSADRPDGSWRVFADLHDGTYLAYHPRTVVTDSTARRTGGWTFVHDLRIRGVGDILDSYADEWHSTIRVICFAGSATMELTEPIVLYKGGSVVEEQSGTARQTYRGSQRPSPSNPLFERLCTYLRVR